MTVRSAFAVIALWLAASAALAQERTPFVVPAEQVVARVKTVAIAPVLQRVSGELPADLAARVEARATEVLTAAGLTVVPSNVYLEIWRPLSEAIGGTYDAGTGELLEAANSVREHTLRELQRLHRADAVLDLALVGGQIPFDYGALWTSWNGSWDLAGQRLQIAGKNVPTRNGMLRVDGVYALVHLSDITQVTLYQDGDPFDWVSFRALAGITHRPAAEAFTPDRLAVVARLLDPLRQAYRPDPPKEKR